MRYSPFDRLSNLHASAAALALLLVFVTCMGANYFVPDSDCQVAESVAADGDSSASGGDCTLSEQLLTAQYFDLFALLPPVALLFLLAWLGPAYLPLFPPDPPIPPNRRHLRFCIFNE